MKTYRRRFAKKALFDSAQKRIETRDGILWSIDESNRKCRVKIQGSNTQIVAHYPRNRKDIPEWMRIGNAVRIAHREGERGYIEVVGEGRAIPTPVAGDELPDSGISGGGIISGMVITPTATPSYYVYISSGTHQIDGVIYTYAGYPGDYILMSDPAPMTMGDTVDGVQGIAMGQVVYFVGNPPSAIGGQTSYRYDAVVVGTDGITETVQGVPATSDPERPAVPTNHTLINYILRTSGVGGVISAERIGETWRTPYPVGIDCSHTAQISSCYLSCGAAQVVGTVPQAHFSFTVINQYGDTIRPTVGNELLVTVDMFSPSRGDIVTGHYYISFPTIWVPILPHAAEDLSIAISNSSYIGRFTYTGEAEVTFLMTVTNVNPIVYGTDSFLQADIEDYDWEYPYDDQATEDTGIYQCL